MDNWVLFLFPILGLLMELRWERKGLQSTQVLIKEARALQFKARAQFILLFIVSFIQWAPRSMLQELGSWALMNTIALVDKELAVGEDEMHQ